MDNFMARNNLIKCYFYDGYTYQEIVHILSKNHQVVISLRHLKRILQSLNLKRKNIFESDSTQVSAAIAEELFNSGCCIGYNSLWSRLKLTYGLKIKRSTVQHILRKDDPDGVADRSRHRLSRRKYSVPGPNFLWHVDGYDKLKPFGFAIHGCIDGFSGKILWLEVATSNNKPEIIAHYFLKTIKKLQALPTLVRSDCGTENCLIEVLQQSLRYYHDDKLAGFKSFIKGKSTSNQRIESYWSQLRHSGLDFWISFFKDMRDYNLYQDSNPIHVECLRYCFGPLIAAELQILRREWNRHRIRKQKNLNSLPGKPNCLFYIPEIFGKLDYKKFVEEDDVNICLNHCSEKPKLYDDNVYELLKLLNLHKVVSSSAEDALHLYCTILDKVEIYSTDVE